MNKSMGEVAFDAYSTAVGGKTWDGKPIPPWSEVKEQVQRGWEAAAQAARDWDDTPPLTKAQQAVIEQIDEMANALARAHGTTNLEGYVLVMSSDAMRQLMGEMANFWVHAAGEHNDKTPWVNSNMGRFEVIVDDDAPGGDVVLMKRADYEYNKLQREGGAS